MSTELQLGDRLADAAAAAPDQLGITVEELRRRGARRRKATIGVAAAAAVLLVAGGTAGVAFSGVAGGGPGKGNSAVGAPPATAGPSAGLPGGLPGGASQPPSVRASEDDGSEYRVVDPAGTVDTGEAGAAGTLTLWFAEHQGRFLQAVGWRGPDGKLSLDGITNDPDVIGNGPGDAGFHAGWQLGSGQDRFVTGYVVGDATKVTLTVDGKPATAKVAAWPQNPAVHVWWLRVPEAPGTVGQAVEVRKLTAYDATGKVAAVIPEGGVGVG